MKGIVFTEFIEMVENRFSFEVADYVMEKTELPSGGIYTSLGTYDHQEMIQLVINLSEATNIPVPQLVRTFGKYLFERFVVIFPHFFVGSQDTFSFLQNIEEYIHVEVKKLYTDAQLPTFECDNSDPNRLIMIYSSARPFADLAEGLILAALDHFGEEITLERENLADDGTSARFILTKVAVQSQEESQLVASSVL